jgi:hypothetical protein
MTGLFAGRKATSERREIRLLWTSGGCREIARYGRNTLFTIWGDGRMLRFRRASVEAGAAFGKRQLERSAASL